MRRNKLSENACDITATDIRMRSHHDHTPQIQRPTTACATKTRAAIASLAHLATLATGRNKQTSVKENTRAAGLRFMKPCATA